MTDQTGSWQPDPNGRHQYRYWDGSQWTDQVANDGVTSVDPPDAGSAPPGDVTPADAPADDVAPEDASAEPTPPADDVPPFEPDPTAATPATSWGTPPTQPDATTSMPIAGDPLAPPAAGDLASPTDAPKKGSGNKPALILGGVLLLALLGAGAWLLLGGDDDEDGRADLIAALVDQGFTEEGATCVIDEVGDDISTSRLLELNADDSDATEEEQAIMLAAALECGVGDEAAPDTTDTTGSDDSDSDDSDDGGLDGDSIAGNAALMDLFIQGVMEGSDLTEEQASCFSEEFLNSDIDLGELMADPEAIGSDAGVMSTILSIFETCDIDPSAMGGDSSGLNSDADTYGDDEALDALWDACEGGDGQACDDLYFQSPVDSEYEEFGDTCGGRFEAGTVLCANEDLG